MSAYLDSSVLVPLVRVETSTPQVAAWLRELSEPPSMSEFGRGEVGSAMARLVRTKLVDRADAIERLEWFDEWARETLTLDVDASHLRAASQLARRFELGLRLPDAIHLALARANGIPLATLDVRLGRAAETVGLAVARL